ncbi:GGDEF domain-containing protein [Rhizobium sp. AQ_MP]|uniref:GGDEF domain-containing protein n=1 Tax=Rhizobium sp. AQ_MP TaxID=2761536 RepID=UPI00163AF4B6|nr:GGDEF domain-containing protein [Rhizobium sp. AQ_MP]MBC2773140.1 GGDEF domain-containing protein [Rhizobium sp. AQ_MP]
MHKLTLPMIGIDDETNPPWEHLSVLFHILPHIVAAIAILCAAIFPLLEGRTFEVAAVAAILAAQVTMRGMADARFRKRDSSDQIRPWLRLFTVVSMLSGLAWGIALAILYSGGSADTQVVVLAIGCGILQSSAARAYLAPRSTLVVILTITLFVNIAAIREGNWIMVPICLAYVGFLASYMVRLIAMDEKRLAAERKTQILVRALADSNDKLMHANEQLRRHARTDALTGLDNRGSFDEELRRHLLLTRNGGNALALLLIDVDHFKRFNDTHGHQAGDQALRVFADLLLVRIRKCDGIAARYGGEEFAVLLHGDHAHSALSIAEDLRLSVGNLLLTLDDGNSARLTVSIGVALAEVADDEHTLVARADRRLYQAKAAGRDRVCDSDQAHRLAGSA